VLFFFGLNKITAGPADIGVEPTRKSAARRLGSPSRLLAPTLLMPLTRFMDTASHNHRLKVVTNKQIGALPLSIGPLRQQK